MFCRSIRAFIFTFVAVAIATGCSGKESNTESSVVKLLRNPSVELGSLLDAGEGAVVALVSGGTRLLAHRAVLAARSPALQRLLQGAATGEVAVPDVEGPVLRRLLAYLYTLQAPQLPAMAPQLLAAAHQYGLPALKADCERQVAAQLTVQTAAATAVLAVRYSSDSLRRAAIVYIRDHFLNVTATQGWADAIRSQPEVMIKVTQLLFQLPGETSTTAPTAIVPCSYPATQPCSNHSSSNAPATAATTTAGQTVPQTKDDHISPLHTTAPTASVPYPYPATQPRSNHSSTHAPATAAPTTAAQRVPQTDVEHISLLRSLSPEEKGRRLIEAAKQGVVREVEALLVAGADVATRDEAWSMTALHWAADRGHEEVARRLLAAGAVVGARDRWRWTPLHEAAREGHAAVARLLLAAGADPSATESNGWTPLDVARREKRRQVVELLEGSPSLTATTLPN